MEEFWSAFSAQDRETICEADFAKKSLYAVVGHSEVAGYFESCKMILRVSLASFQIVRQTADFQGEISKVNVGYFNNKYLLLGFKDGVVEIRDTETLEKVYCRLDSHFEGEVL